MLWVERADHCRTDALDVAITRAVTDALGADMWHNALLTLTHAGQGSLQGQLRRPGTSWEAYIERRSTQVWYRS